MNAGESRNGGGIRHAYISGITFAESRCGGEIIISSAITAVKCTSGGLNTYNVIRTVNYASEIIIIIVSMGRDGILRCLTSCDCG